MEAPATLSLNLQPAQGRAFMTRATEVLYGGAAGGGKSHLMRVACIIWATLIPGLQIALFRRMYPDLVANHMEGPTSFPVLCAPLVAQGKCRIIQTEIGFANGSRISLHHCNLEKDMYRYAGFEFHVLIIDELTHFTEKMYRFLRSRVRMSGVEMPEHLKGLFPRILCGANPGNIGHVWVKKTFVANGAMVIHQASDEEGGMKRQYIPAKVSDNPALLESDPSYVSRLSGLGDPLLVRAMLDGDWSIAAGAMFGETWREGRHTCQPFAIPVDWKIWRGADDGYGSPACCLWLTQDPETETIYVIAEIYDKGMLPDEYARRVHKIDTNIPRWYERERMRRKNTTIIKGELDSAAFADKGEQGQDGKKAIPRGPQINAKLASLGCGKFEPCRKWQNARIHGVQNMHRLMGKNPKCPHGGPGIRFFKNCRSAIEEIPALPRDLADPEDVNTKAPDHSWDALRYALQRVFTKAGKVQVSF